MNQILEIAVAAGFSILGAALFGTLGFALGGLLLSVSLYVAGALVGGITGAHLAKSAGKTGG